MGVKMEYVTLVIEFQVLSPNSRVQMEQTKRRVAIIDIVRGRVENGQFVDVVAYLAR